MIEQNKLTYPKSIGEELWLYFILFLDARLFTGVVKTTVQGLHTDSGIPVKELKPALQKLVRHRFITLRRTKQNALLIKLKHYGSRKSKLARSKSSKVLS